ncbi:STAS domain-containing protein [Salsuginibacillus kocurii]|uniref:STAS domain-containing protein n=1 Tax=Salsuginibacillus kocurii TaxID=427078 RepID=UPI000362932B|nr:STAS domain-containing protein [Salsuginibacillus kocurii]
MNLTLQTKETEAGTRVMVEGEIDAYTAPELRETLIPLTEKQNTEVVVDLANVEYIDSTGLGIFIGALKSAHSNGSELAITGVNERVHRLFSITGLDEVIDIDGERREGAK